MENSTFYIVEAILYSFFSSVFFALWIDLRPPRSPKDQRQEPTRRSNEPSFMWISLAILVWGIKAVCFSFLSYKGIPLEQGLNQNDPPSDSVILFSVVISSLNNVFFILALLYSDYFPDPLKVLQQNNRWKIALIGLPLIAALGVFTSEDSYRRSTDLLFSLGTLALLAYVFFQSFYNRGLKGIALISTFALIAIGIVQPPIFDLLQIPTSGNMKIGLSIIARVFISSSLLLLILSWIRHKGERPKEEEIKLRLFRVPRGDEDATTAKTKRPYRCEYYIPGINQSSGIAYLPPEPFKVLLKLCVDRLKPGAYSENGWVGHKELGQNYNNIVIIRKEMGIDSVGTLIENEVGKGYRLRTVRENIELGKLLREHPDLESILRKLEDAKVYG